MQRVLLRMHLLPMLPVIVVRVGMYVMGEQCVAKVAAVLVGSALGTVGLGSGVEANLRNAVLLVAMGGVITQEVSARGAPVMITETATEALHANGVQL